MEILKFDEQGIDENCISVLNETRYLIYPTRM